MRHREAVCETKRLCPAGAYVSTDDMVRGRVCSQCPSGFYMAEASHTLDACAPHANCRLGQQLLNATAATRGVCQSCGAGRFRASFNYSRCESFPQQYVARLAPPTKLQLLNSV